MLVKFCLSTNMQYITKKSTSLKTDFALLDNNYLLASRFNRILVLFVMVCSKWYLAGVYVERGNCSKLITQLFNLKNSKTCLCFLYDNVTVPTL